MTTHDMFRLIVKSIRIGVVLLALGILAGAGLANTTADRIVIMKSKRTMELRRGDEILKMYRIALGGTPVGPKQREGDHKTPEGIYRIDTKNAWSHYHLSLHISYPSAVDRQRAQAMGVSPGGDIMIHGLPPGYGWLGASHRQVDWTDGCIAVSNTEIEEIWKLVPVGTTVEIKP